MSVVGTIRRNLTILGLALAVLAALSAESQAEMYSYGFACITNNSLGNATIGQNQLSVDVSDSLNGVGLVNQVLFGFHNEGSSASAICDVYFDDGALLVNIAMLIDEDDNRSYGGDLDVDFSRIASPGELPGANNVIPNFVTTAGFSADSDAPVRPNGVGPGEWLGIVFNLKTDSEGNQKTYGDVLADIATGALRIGIHVQGFANGGSESFVNNPPVVPMPGAMLLGSLGLGVAACRLRRRKELV